MLKKTMSHKISFILMIAVLAVSFPFAASAKSFNTIVSFGDSLSDHGGLSSYLGVYDPAANPGGVPEVWSNGDVWVEYLADKMKADPMMRAIGGAMTTGHENSDIQALSDAGTLPPLGLAGQVNTFRAASPEFTPDDTLFTIWIGGNNLLEFLRGETPFGTPAAMIDSAMTDIRTAIRTLYAGGATHFLILNLPDLGKTPAFNRLPPADIAGITSLVGSYNSSLSALFNILEGSLPDSEFYWFDVFAFMNNMISENVFNNVTGTYLEIDTMGNRTGNTNGPAEDYLFWDLIHPMTRAHQYVGDEVFKESFGSDEDDSCFIKTMGGGSLY